MVLLVNLATHPLYRYARASLFPHEQWLLGVALLEPLVVVAEAAAYAAILGMPRRRAAIASLAANGASLAAGLAGRFLAA